MMQLSEIVDRLLRNRFLLLVGALLLTAVCWPIAGRLSFDQSIESLYSPDDPYLNSYLESKSWFGGDEFVLVAYTDPGLFTAEGFERLRTFSSELSSIPGINSAATQNLADALSPPELNFFFRFLLRTQEKALRELLEGVLVGSDGETTAIILRLEPNNVSNPVPRGETFAKIRRLARKHSPRAYVVGEPVQVHDMFRYVEEDGALLFRVSLIVLGLVILFLFRSFRWVVLPLTVVIVTIVTTEATLVVSQMRLSMVSSMLNSLVTIIGIATVTHVTVHYRELRKRKDRYESLRQTLIELLPAIFWTCATTAAGFAALLSSEITPVRSFGFMMAIGTFVVLLATSGVLPGGILAGRKAIDPSDAPAEQGLVRLLQISSFVVERHPVILSISAFLLVAFAAVGFSRLKVETDFSKNFRESSPIVQGLNFVEERLGGAGTWEVNFPAPHELTDEFLDEVRLLSETLTGYTVNETQPLTKVMSITDTLDMVPSRPFSRNTISSKLAQITEMQPDFESSFYNSEQGRMRLVLRAKERQPSEEKLALIHAVEQMARKQFPEAKTTGIFVLLAYLIESLLRDQLVSFGLAAVSIGTMMTIAFRSFRIGLISLVPNLFPIVIVIGAMGWVGLPVNIGTAMIASVSMGLTTDSSIHYIAGYRRARNRGLTPSDAILTTHKAVGRAIVFATFALVAGFSVLTLSHFIPLIYFGALISLAMLGGLVGDLLLLPLLLRWFKC